MLVYTNDADHSGRTGNKYKVKGFFFFFFFSFSPIYICRVFFFFSCSNLFLSSFTYFSFVCVFEVYFGILK